MCLACEQQGMWLAYLKRRGLITEDGYLVEEPPLLADAGGTQSAEQAGVGEAPAGSADLNKVSGDDPKAG
jgi:hypothetical protein